MKIALTSTSAIKKYTVEAFFESLFGTIDLITLPNTSNTPPQPLDEGGRSSCIIRLGNVSHKEEYDYIVSIENYIDTNLKFDFCYIIIYHNKETHYGVSKVVRCNPTLLAKVLAQDMNNYTCKGVEKTYGQFVYEKDNTYSADNWMAQDGYTRSDQITDALRIAHQKFEMCKEITVHVDYPIPGIVFQDILPMFHNHETFTNMTNIMAHEVSNFNCSHIVGLESRGFLLGTALAFKLGIGFIPIRKKGKLACKTYEIEYTKEYGKDVAEMAVLPNLEGKHVIIVDDLIATGGSMKAAIDLCHKNKFIVDICVVLRHVMALRKTYMETIYNFTLIIML